MLRRPFRKAIAIAPKCQFCHTVGDLSFHAELVETHSSAAAVPGLRDVAALLKTHTVTPGMRTRSSIFNLDRSILQLSKQDQNELDPAVLNAKTMLLLLLLSSMLLKTKHIGTVF